MVSLLEELQREIGRSLEAYRPEAGRSSHQGLKVERELAQALLQSGVQPDRLIQGLEIRGASPLVEFDLLFEHPTSHARTLLDVKLTPIDRGRLNPRQQLRLAASDAQILKADGILWRPNWDREWPHFEDLQAFAKFLGIALVTDGESKLWKHLGLTNAPSLLGEAPTGRIAVRRVGTDRYELRASESELPQIQSHAKIVDRKASGWIIVKVRPGQEESWQQFLGKRATFA